MISKIIPIIKNPRPRGGDMPDTSSGINPKVVYNPVRVKIIAKEITIIYRNVLPPEEMAPLVNSSSPFP